MAKCKRCRADDAKARRQADPEAARLRDRQRYERDGSRYNPEYYQRNKAHMDATNRAWAAAHPDRRREIGRQWANQWRKDHPEEARQAWAKENARRSANRPPPRPRPRKYATDADRKEAYKPRRSELRRGPEGEKERQYNRQRAKERRRADLEGTRAKERERARQWRLANPEAARRKGQRDSSKRNALKRNADTRSVTERDLHRLLVRQRGCCAYCDAPEPTTLDHVVPLARGGRHSIGNLVWACAPCNKSKGARLAVEYRHGRSYRRQPAA